MNDMLIPRFTIRTILIFTAGAAVFFLVFGLAYRGHVWAQRFAIAAAIFAFVMVIHAALYLVVWGFSRLSKETRDAESIASESRTST